MCPQLVGHILHLSGVDSALVRIPSPVAAAMPPPPASSNGGEDMAAYEEEDDGFMYLPLGAANPRGSTGGTTPEAPAAAPEVHRCFGPDRHVFWPADGF